MDDKLLRKRLGGRLLTERVQEKGWNESKAAAEADCSPKTIRRIERGENYEMESLERYARALGKPLSDWLIEILTKETQRSEAPTTPPSAAGGSFR